MWNFFKIAKEKFYLQFLWFSAVRIILLMLSTLISFICHRLHIVSAIYIFLQDATVPGGSGNPYYRGFPIKLRHITLVMTPPDEWSALPDSTPLIWHSYPSPPGGFETAIPATERAQTHALDRSATGIDPAIDGVAKAPVSPQWNTSKTDSLQLPSWTSHYELGKTCWKFCRSDEE
jgi:hypothetical protein